MMKTRLRRLRSNPEIRDFFQETILGKHDVMSDIGSMKVLAEGIAQTREEFEAKGEINQIILGKAQTLEEARNQLDEGADGIAVEDSLFHLDLIASIKSQLHCPVVAILGSVENTMILAGSQNQCFQQDKVVYESHISIKRAGADIIITPYAREILEKWV